MSKKVEYHTNWMGPINYAWIMKFGTDWSSGRIDVYSGSSLPEPLSLPTMKKDDWTKFSEWLKNFRTNDVWTTQQLIQEYEKSHPPIKWFKNPAWKQKG